MEACYQCSKPIEEKDLALVDSIDDLAAVCRACYDNLRPQGQPYLADDSRGNARVVLPFSKIRKLAARLAQAIAELAAEALIRGSDQTILGDMGIPDRPAMAFRGVPIAWVPELPDDGRGNPVYSESFQGPAPIQSRDGMSRNKPCFCGSGKKYKHCHLRRSLGD